MNLFYDGDNPDLLIVGMKWIVVVAVIVGCVSGVATRSQPPPTPQFAEPTPQSADPTDQKHKDADQPGQPSPEPVASRQIIATTNNDEPATTHEQNKTDRLADDLMNPITWITAVIALFACWQVIVYRQMRDHTKVVERAYIGVSHVRLTELREDSASIRMKIMNRGKTPGQVLGGNIWWSATDTPGSQLVELKKFIDVAPMLLTAEASMMCSVDVPVGKEMLATHTWWLSGEVHYEDRFGDVHEAGFGRRYDRAKNHLIFDESTRGLNYDQPMTRQERRQYLT
ncbi:MAG: hypothetical protein NT151_00680 [Acidobacteria bacterium]|nr:hypothetical protein [Acidobacteriota bacterium]